MLDCIIANQLSRRLRTYLEKHHDHDAAKHHHSAYGTVKATRQCQMASEAYENPFVFTTDIERAS